MAAELGMKVFWLTDCAINKVGAREEDYPHGDFDALMSWLRAQLRQRPTGKAPSLGKEKP